jgi:hypothetical protein
MTTTEKHGLPLPTDRRRLKIGFAKEALAIMGYTLGTASTDLVRKVTTYSLTKPDGSVVIASTEQIAEIVYQGA